MSAACHASHARVSVRIQRCSSSFFFSPLLPSPKNFKQGLLQLSSGLVLY